MVSQLNVCCFCPLWQKCRFILFAAFTVLSFDPIHYAYFFGVYANFIG